jgi:hypothetical protein
VCPGLARRIPTVCMLLSAFFQERVSYFTVYMLLLQDATISEQDMGISVLEASSLTESEKLIMDKAVLNSI